MQSVTPSAKNDFDPIFRLFTVIYGAVVAFSLKPFGEALINEKRAPQLDLYDLILLVALAAFFVIDWMWSAAYLLNWPKSQRTNKFYQGFCDASKARRGMLLVCHVGLICSFAIFANVAWLTSWKPPSLAIACPLFWLSLAFSFSILWESSMFLFNKVNVVRSQAKTFLGFAYFVIEVIITATVIICFLFITEIVKGESRPFFQIKDMLQPLWASPRFTAIGALLAQILLHLLTYFHFDELVVIEGEKANAV